MPASMMIAPTGEVPNVNGSRIDTVAIGPMPGRTPISVPIRQPSGHRPRLVNVNATEMPSARSDSMSLQAESAQRERGHRHLEHEAEQPDAERDQADREHHERHGLGILRREARDDDRQESRGSVAESRRDEPESDDRGDDERDAAPRWPNQHRAG